MRKFFALGLSLAMVFTLAACGSSSSQKAQNDTETASSIPASEDAAKSAEAESEETLSSTPAEESEASEQAETEPEETSGDTPAEESEAPGNGGGKALVVYYSATGSTEAVAQTIADAVGGDLFELEPVETYTSDDLDWTNSDSRVSVEHDNEDQREVELVSASVENWDEYDTVFIGYPIWWGIAAWPVNEFVQTNDFTGKTVIPFCTSASSGLGESGELLEEMAGTGTWQEGERFSSGASDSDVQAWVDELGIVKE